MEYFQEPWRGVPAGAPEVRGPGQGARAGGEHRVARLLENLTDDAIA